MRKAALAISLAMIIGSGVPAMADWQIGFGKDKGQVGVRPPQSEEDFPLGPSSYRLLNEDLWVLDSAGARLIRYGSDNAVTGEISLAGPDNRGFASDALLDDFAVQLTDGKASAVIAIDSMHRQIIKFDINGKELLNIKVAPEKLVQLDAVEIDSNGQFYIGDYGNAYIAVFAADGKMLRTIPWQCSGFTLDAENNLYMIEYSEEKGHAVIKRDASGAIVSQTLFGMPEVQNPLIWKADKEGFVVSVVPSEGDPTNHWLLKLAAGGEILNKTSFKNPYYIKRYLMAAKDNTWIVQADYSKPETKIVVLPVK